MYRGRSRDAESARWRLTAAAALAVLTAVRAAPVLLANFPLGDGGLLAVMAADLRHAGFTLPAATSYNDGTIPFVYPPLGIYVLALIPGDPVQTERWLPLVFSYLATGAAFLLARSLAGQRLALVTTAAIAVMPVTWAIEGGGVVRGLGFALLLLTLWRAEVLLKSPGLINASVTGFVAAAALLSHPAVGPAGVVSSLLLLAGRPSRWGALCLLIAAGIAAVLVAPWVVAVVSVHGFDPWIRGATAHTQDPAILRLVTYGPSGLATFDPIPAAAVVGAAVALRSKRWLVPVWLAALYFVPGGGDRFAAFPWALLAAEGGVLVYDALRPFGAHRIAAGAVAVLVGAASLVVGYRSYKPISIESRTAESPVPHGLDDAAVEWWPTLTGRSSPIVYFGYEWTDQWETRVGAYRDAQRGSGNTAK